MAAVAVIATVMVVRTIVVVWLRAILAIVRAIVVESSAAFSVVTGQVFPVCAAFAWFAVARRFAFAWWFFAAAWSCFAAARFSLLAATLFFYLFRAAAAATVCKRYIADHREDEYQDKWSFFHVFVFLRLGDKYNNKSDASVGIGRFYFWIADLTAETGTR